MVLATGLFSSISGCDKAADAPAAFRGVDITGADYAQGFSLTDADGKTRTLADFRGKVVVLFFGFTQCPDVCPTTLAELVQVRQLLGADGARVQGVFVTVDPQRDTPEVLKAYTANFDPSFVALRPTPEQLAALPKDFRIYFKQVPGPTPTSYTMDHSAASFVYDTAGRIRLYQRYGSGAEVLAADIRALLRQG